MCINPTADLSEIKEDIAENCDHTVKYDDGVSRIFDTELLAVEDNCPV